VPVYHSGCEIYACVDGVTDGAAQHFSVGN